MRKSRIAQENETVIEGTPVGVASMGEVVTSGIEFEDRDETVTGAIGRMRTTIGIVRVYVGIVEE